MVSESARHRPPDVLRPLVGWYSGYREVDAPPARHRGLPSPWLTLIVTLDDPLTISEHPDPHQPASAHQVLIGGLHTTPALVTHDGRESGIQLGLTPLGARALLGFGAAWSALSSAVVLALPAVRAVTAPPPGSRPVATDADGTAGS